MIKFDLWGSTYHLSGSKVVIVDLDGTLADGRGRLRLLPTKDLHLTESWSEFNKAAVNDRPIQDTIDIVSDLWHIGYVVIILTGRSDEVHDDTVKWLHDNKVKYDALIMRRHTDNRKDTVLKEEVLRAIGLDNITCAFDDSPNVIRHFRSLGITTYAVTEYETERADVKSHGVDK